MDPRILGPPKKPKKAQIASAMALQTCNSAHPRQGAPQGNLVAIVASFNACRRMEVDLQVYKNRIIEYKAPPLQPLASRPMLAMLHLPPPRA